MNSPTKAILVTAVLAALASGVAVRRHPRYAARPSQGPITQPSQPGNGELWAPERIVKDPQGYIEWSDQQVQAQIAQRQTRLKSLADQHADLDARRSQTLMNLGEVQNLHDRVQRGYRNADDEERWPLKMAGKESRDAADAVLTKTQRYIDDRKSLAQTYDEALARLDQLTAMLHRDISDLDALREKLALDLEKVKLNQGIAEMDQFRKTEGELESMSKTLAAIDEQSVASLPAPSKEGSDRQDVAEMLR